MNQWLWSVVHRVTSWRILCQEITKLWIMHLIATKRNLWGTLPTAIHLFSVKYQVMLLIGLQGHGQAPLSHAQITIFAPLEFKWGGQDNRGTLHWVTEGHSVVSWMVICIKTSSERFRPLIMEMCINYNDRDCCCYCCFKFHGAIRDFHAFPVPLPSRVQVIINHR